MFRRLLVPLVAVSITAPGLHAQDQSSHLDLSLYLEWERATSPQIAPDGAQIIYTRRWVDKINDRWESSLWIMNSDGSRNRYLTDGSSARWSPDGTRIAFLQRGDPSGTQIFVRWMDAEGATSQVTRVENTPGNVRWSPDGERIAFTMTVDDASPWKVQLPDRPSGARWTESPKVVTRMRYRRDRRGYIDDGHQHIFVVPASGGTPRQLTDGQWGHSGPAWTPDGTEILFSSLRTEEAEYQWRESEIYAVHLTTGTFGSSLRVTDPTDHLPCHPTANLLPIPDTTGPTTPTLHAHST